MGYIKNKTKLIYTKHRKKNDISELNWLRLRIIYIINIVFVALLTPAIIIVLFQGDFTFNNVTSIILSITSVFILLFSNLLIAKGYLRPPILITVLFVPSLCFLLVFFKLSPYQAMFPQLCLLLAYNIWMLGNYKIRIYYSAIYFGFLFQLYYLHNSLIETITTMLMILGYVIVFHVLALFIENQGKHQIRLNKTLSKKNDELQVFNHIMSHDLKSPLGNISSLSQLIKDEVTFQDESHKQYFNFIENSADEMRTLIDDLLIYHKVESDIIDFTMVNLNEVINEISTTYKSNQIKKNIQFNFKPLPEVTGNYTLLKALFGNLISNSIKYQPKDKSDHIPQIKIWSTSNEKDFEIYISDNGIGFNKKHIENLFLPFKRFHKSSEYEGTGLGMSICKNIMDKHLGTIELDKTSEKGTTFKLNFPKTSIIKNK